MRSLAYVVVAMVVAAVVVVYKYNVGKDAGREGSVVIQEPARSPEARVEPEAAGPAREPPQPHAHEEPAVTAEEYAVSADVGGITLKDLFVDAPATIRAARETLMTASCVDPVFRPDHSGDCAQAQLYEAALLYDYCRGAPPPEAFPPERLEDQFGVTDVQQLRRAEQERKVQAIQREIIQRECADLIDSLLALPRLVDTSALTDTDPHAEGLTKHQRNSFAYRLHAALLGDRRAGRWIVQDWLAMKPGYIDEREIERVVQSYAGTPEGHRLTYQWEVHRSPSIDCCDGYDDEDRRVDAAAHLLAYRALAPGYYEEPADTRWMLLHEKDFMERLDQNQISLAMEQAHRLLNDQ